ncbi:hypothetical protein [Shinella sp. HZN7]|uniref:hypothetical protein n=1 Tax=Shinella sp. (strain HZN7) TaxID=879274 RepID=UPI0007DA7CD0|nr:hypothetical protein [Shinella sp. HZN7]ANH08950.1 hypothetical protein shn_32975 [Shinella sp. HZN7]
MHAARVIFAFQVVPGTDEILGFAETLGITRQEASQHFEGLRTMEANIDAGIAIYRVGLKEPSPSDVVALLNTRRMRPTGDGFMRAAKPRADMIVMNDADRRKPGQKKGHEKLGPYRYEGNLNLQRGTAAAAPLGGKPPCASAVCIMIAF